MKIITQKLKKYVWENFILYKTIFSEKVYKTLLQFRNKNDKVNFDNTLEAIIELDSELLTQIERQYQPIEEMSIEDIYLLLEINTNENFITKSKYIDRALYFVESYPKKDRFFIQFFIRIATYFNHMKDEKQALFIAEKAFNLGEEILEEKNPTRLTTYNMLGLVYMSKGEYQKALPLFEKTLKISKEIYKEEDSHTASSYSNLAKNYSKIGEYEKALSFYQKNLEIVLNIFGKKNYETSISYDKLSGFYFDIGNYKKALKFGLKALDINKEILGTNHLNTAINYNSLSLIYGKLRENQKALFYIEQAVEINSNRLGTNHPTTTTVLNNLALAYQAIGEYQKAKELFLKGLSKNEKNFGRKHLTTATNFYNLGHVHHLLEEYVRAEVFYKLSLEIRKKILGENHLDISQVYNGLGGVFQSKKEYEKAEKYYFKSLEIFKNFFGESHSHVANVYGNIGVLYLKMAKYKKALDYMKISLEIFENTLGITHPSTVENYFSIAMVHDIVKEKKEAIYYDNKVMKIIEENPQIDYSPYIAEFYEYKKRNNFFPEVRKIFNFFKPLFLEKQIEKDIVMNLTKESNYLKSIKIQNYFSIKDIEITDLMDKKEIYLVGENGDGKTILLQAILLSLKKDYSGSVVEYIREIKDNMYLATKDEHSPIDYNIDKDIKNIFAYGINRNKIHYKDFDKYGYGGLFDTTDSRKTTFLKDPIIVLLEKNSLIDKFIEELNSSFLVNNLTIEKSKTEIIFKEDSIEIDFEHLSEGYKSTIIWLSDLLSRMIENDTENEVEELADFKAIVLIDEVDLYLHPKWKYDFMNKLRKIFPKIQFIMTTHSLVTVLGASEDAVFYKVYKEDGETKITSQIDDISYYTSDILMTSPLFNMKTIKSRAFADKESLSSDDYVYYRIHKKIKEKIDKIPTATDEDVDSWLDDAFDEEFGE